MPESGLITILMNVPIYEEVAKSKRGWYHLVDRQQDVMSPWICCPTLSKKFHLDACRFAFYPQMIEQSPPGSLAIPW